MENLKTLVLISICIQTTMAGEGILREFERNELVPQIFDIGPPLELGIKYSGVAMKPGAEFTPTEAKDQPEIGSWSGDPSKFYALIMLDPDAISRSAPMFRSVLHWYVGNIPGNDISQGTVMASYRGPGPPIFTGLHRYVTLVYEQLEGRIEYPTSYFYVRPWFSMQKAITKFKLSNQPIAGNFFQSKRS